MTMERTCEVERPRARAAGPVVAMSDEAAAAAYEQVGGHTAGWFCG